MRLILITLSFFIPFVFSAQILDITPVFPQVDDNVTIIYNAEEGNGALQGIGPVYAHTGLITEASTTPNDWNYTQGNWGTPDPNVLMTQVGTNLWQISYNIRDYYGLPQGEKAHELAFVFRNNNGSIVGRSASGGDIFYPIYNPEDGLLSFIISPTAEILVKEVGESIQFKGAASLPGQLTLLDNGEILAQTTGEVLEFEIPVTDEGFHLIEFVASAIGDTLVSSFRYFTKPDVTIQDPPPGLKDGINVINDSTAILQLVAPDKEFVMALGSYNNWTPLQEFTCKKSVDGIRHWVELTGLDPDSVNLSQYLVDGEILIADPYSELVLDRFGDGFIPDSIFPNMPGYPIRQTGGIVGVFDTKEETYPWQVTDFEKPKKTDLVIYELLVRDFLEDASYLSLIDTLNYFERLGINAIELMPVNEFEGNLSWGYNPSYHMALDKFYGSPELFKAFVDACHTRGIAVILDVVYNHAFSQNPLVQLYFDPNTFWVRPDNPWLNPAPKHDFNVGYDFNHESQLTRNYVKQIMEYWLTEYKVDGFRFDLSKGFTQKNTLGNVAAWGQKDDDRIEILKDYADKVWSVDPDAYVILEHFAENSEEKELAEYGMILWGNLNHNYSQASMGFNDSNFSWGSYKNRGWNVPHVVTYMESHDEERMMYRNLEFGNSQGSYDVRELEIALERIELAAAFFFTIPGPKMIWEFGELGYDFSINHCPDGTINENCRLAPKPIRWDYQDQVRRKHLYDVFKALIDLKQQPALESSDFTLQVSDPQIKKIFLNHESFDMAVLGNFGMTSKTFLPDFQYLGTWYDYLTGDSINISSANQPISLQAGEYLIYTSERLATPDIVSSIFDLDFPDVVEVNIYPQPSQGKFRVSFQENLFGKYSWRLFDSVGKAVSSGIFNFNGEEFIDMSLNDSHNTGMYFLQIANHEKAFGSRVMLNR